MKNIGEKAKEFRESRVRNPTRMAKEVGTSRQNIENLEATGNRQPRYIDKLAKDRFTVFAVIKTAGSCCWK